jgi:hypothetical protein
VIGQYIGQYSASSRELVRVGTIARARERLFPGGCSMALARRDESAVPLYDAVAGLARRSGLPPAEVLAVLRACEASW